MFELIQDVTLCQNMEFWQQNYQDLRPQNRERSRKDCKFLLPKKFTSRLAFEMSSSLSIKANVPDVYLKTEKNQSNKQYKNIN